MWASCLIPAPEPPHRLCAGSSSMDSFGVSSLAKTRSCNRTPPAPRHPHDRRSNMPVPSSREASPRDSGSDGNYALWRALSDPSARQMGCPSPRASWACKSRPAAGCFLCLRELPVAGALCSNEGQPHFDERLSVRGLCLRVPSASFVAPLYRRLSSMDGCASYTRRRHSNAQHVSCTHTHITDVGKEDLT